MNAFKKIIAVAMIATMVLGCFTCFCFSTSAANKSEIVKEGLVAWYDGANNSNGTQKTDTTTWKDLSGNGHNLELYLDEDNAWKTNAFHIDSHANYFPQGVLDVINGEAFTMEFAFGVLEYLATRYITFASSDNDKLSLFIELFDDGRDILQFKYQNTEASRPKSDNGGQLSNNATLTAVFTEGNPDDCVNVSGTNLPKHYVKLYINGDLLAEGYSVMPNQADSLMFGNANEDRAWSGDIHAIRFYDRALSDDEIIANAQADQNNYRSGETFEPTIEFEEEGNEDEEGGEDVETPTYTNTLIPLNAQTNVMEWNMAFAENVYGVEENQDWARFQVTDPTVDHPGNSRQPHDTGFPDVKVNYQKFCRMNNLVNLTGEDVNYVVLKLRVEGPMEDMEMWTCTGTVIDFWNGAFGTGSYYGGIDTEKGDEIQYLIYDVEGVLEGEVNSFAFSPSGWDETTIIHMYELAIFATEEEAFAYAGEAAPIETTGEETTAEETTAEDTAEDTTAAGTEAGTKAEETTAAADEGCGSVVGFGAAAILVAAAAAVVLKKKD